MVGKQMPKRKHNSVFLDEGGNTGPDLLNLEQPVFVLGAIGFPTKKLSKVESAILSLRKKYKIPEDQELKGARLLRSSRRWIVKEIIDTILEHGRIFLCVVEKRFNICSFLVDDLLDPVYNDACDNSWTHPRPEKPEIADFFYKH